MTHPRSDQRRVDPPRTDLPRAELPADVHAALDLLFHGGPFARTVGVGIDGWGPGWAQAVLRSTEQHGNVLGTVHGGAMFSLADAAFEVACNSWGRVAVALDMTAHHAAEAAVGAVLRAVAVEVTRSRRVASYRIEVADERGEVKAWYQATAYRTARWHLGEQAWPPHWVAEH